MSVPEPIREEMRARLWVNADSLGWMGLPTAMKAKHYEAWTRDPSIGGLLARYMPVGHVRLYLKDAVLKNYARNRLDDAAMALGALGLPEGVPISGSYVKPHGRLLADGRLVCWGKANEWKGLLMSAFERANAREGLTPFAIILTGSNGKFKQDRIRSIVDSAARRLGVERLVWME